MLLRKILVPVDLSERSLESLRFAVALARDLMAPPRIDVLHVVPSGVSDLDALDVARDAVKEVVHGVEHAGIDIDVRITSGDPATCTVIMAVEESADLIVLGTHGRAGISELVLGSVAKKIIACAPCPVTTMRVPPLSSSRRQP
jgi:nucleotide-binding universal stress UspA family protein